MSGRQRWRAGLGACLKGASDKGGSDERYLQRGRRRTQYGEIALRGYRVPEQL